MPGKRGRIALWLIGSLHSRNWQHWGVLWPWATVSLVTGLALAGVANVLHLSDDLGVGLGLRIERSRALLLAAGVLPNAVATSTHRAARFRRADRPQPGPPAGRRRRAADHRAGARRGRRRGALRMLRRRDHSAIDRALELTRMTSFASRPLSELSDGEQQRAWIALALAQDTATLLREVFGVLANVVTDPASGAPVGIPYAAAATNDLLPAST